MKIVCPFIILSLLLSLLACKNDSNQNTKSNEESYLEDFSESKYKWGYMNKSGRVEIYNTFDDCGNFSEGYAIANSKGKWGYIDKKGSFVVSPKYRATWPVKDGFGRVLDFDGIYSFINMIDLTVVKVDSNEISDFSNNRSIYSNRSAKGYINKTGKLVIPFQYTKAGSFSKEGFAIVCVAKNCGVIDTNGSEVVELTYSKIEAINEGVALVASDEGKRYFDLTSKTWILDYYDDATEVHNNIALVRNSNTWMAININGTNLDDLGSQDHVRYLGEDIWALRSSGRSQLWSDKREFTSDASADMFYDFNEGMTVYGEKKGFGYMDTTGSKITPPAYPLLWNFQDGLARTIDHRGITFINNKTQEVFTTPYYEVRDFHDGFARVQIQ